MVHRFMGEGTINVLLVDPLLLRILSEHLHITTKRDGADIVFSFTDLFTHDSRAKSECKLQDPYSRGLCNQEVTEFMEEDQYPECQYGIKHD